MAFSYKPWLRFYLKLILVATLNGIIRFTYVLTGAGLASATQMVDIKVISFAGAGWLLLSTIIVSIAGSLYKHQIPDPDEPEK